MGQPPPLCLLTLLAVSSILSYHFGLDDMAQDQEKNIKRTLGKAILEASASFKVVLLTGPRQVGKTTLLQDVQKGERSYVTLDDLNMRRAAQQDPASFLDRLQLLVLIVEGQ